MACEGRDAGWGRGGKLVIIKVVEPCRFVAPDIRDDFALHFGEPLHDVGQKPMFPVKQLVCIEGAIVVDIPLPEESRKLLFDQSAVDRKLCPHDLENLFLAQSMVPASID